MGRIQANIGLITGVPIGETVDALMKLAERPKDLLVERTQVLQNEQLAVSELSVALLKVKYITDSLGKEDLYDQRKADSTNADALSATVTGKPPEGTYQFTPLRVAQGQQLISSGLISDTDPLGGGTLTFRFGDQVTRSASLELFGGGEGVARGKIRITDRSGVSAEIDLSTVQTVDDVLEAINGNSVINVTAVTQGDRLRLIDKTGQTVSNLKVQEIGNGTTAASLGLGNIDVAEDVADGQDMIRLYDRLRLDAFNDGSGVRTDRAMDDIQYELRDGTTGTIDLSPIIPDGTEVDEEITLADLLQVVNSAEPEKLKLEIAADGDRLVLRDLTEGAGNFSVQALNESRALADLGLDGPVVDGAVVDGAIVDGAVVGRRVLSGTGTVLLSSLNGGNGFGQLGSIELTDRNGASSTVDLSASETLEEVIDALNAAGLEIAADVNQAGNGIQLVDLTGAAAGNLIVSSGDATGTAEKLGVAVNDDVQGVNSGDMHLQVVAHNTKLSDLNGGAGIARSTFTIMGTHGKRATVDLKKDGVETVGDVIREINWLDLDIIAELNPTGDGILIRDTGHGPVDLTIEEGPRTTAADLHLLRPGVEVDFEGQPTQVIDGTATFTVALDETDSLEDLQQAINDIDAGITAMTLFDGSSSPYRLALISERTGKAGNLVFDTSEVGFSLQETVSAQDALLVFGPADNPAANILIASPSNSFSDVISDVTLDIKAPSANPVTISVSIDDSDLIANAQTMVDNYNGFRDRLKTLTTYDPEANAKAILTGDLVALRLDSELSYLISGAFLGAGDIRSLAEVGIRIGDNGKLSFDASKLKAKYQVDPDAVKQFFVTEEFGVSAKFDRLLDELCSDATSLLSQRLNTIREKIETNDQRIEFLDERLKVQRERMLLEFYRMELAIGKMQNNLSSLDLIKPLSVKTSSQSD